ncbi:MAG: hypothetical protein M3N29_05915 [Chloroflexota bacterium]|nr:hypothetical protein [Chloroflexota bacterium]
MRYKGPRTNWWPIVLLILVAVIVLAALFFLFLAPPAGEDRTPTPDQQTPATSPTESPAP